MFMRVAGNAASLEVEVTLWPTVGAMTSVAGMDVNHHGVDVGAPRRIGPAFQVRDGHHRRYQEQVYEGAHAQKPGREQPEDTGRGLARVEAVQPGEADPAGQPKKVSDRCREHGQLLRAGIPVLLLEGQRRPKGRAVRPLEVEAERVVAALSDLLSLPPRELLCDRHELLADRDPRWLLAVRLARAGHAGNLSRFCRGYQAAVCAV